MKKRILTGISVALITLSLGLGVAFANESKTVEINTQTLNVRLDADINAGIIYKAGIGQRFPMVSQQGKWIAIKLDNGRDGWVYSDYVKTIESTKTGIISGDNVNIRQGASLVAPSSGTLQKGQSVQIIGSENEWTRVRLENGAEGFVYSGLISDVQYSSAVSRGSARSSNMVELATSKIGARYSRGSEGPDAFDCSGFVKYIYKEAYGKSLPHNSRSQYSVGSPVTKDEIQVGDMVFFATAGSSSINHSGIYMGKGKFIHASSYDGKVLIDSMDTGHYSRAYRGARRLD